MMKHPGTARNFEGTLRELAQRGHRVQVVVEADRGLHADRVLIDLRRAHPTLSIEAGAKVKRDRWTALKDDLRLTADFLRYLEPRYADAHRLRERARESAPALAARLERSPLTRSPALTRALLAVTRYLEQVLPPSKGLARFLAERRPDVVLVSPLVGLGSRQADIVRAARWLDIPSVLPVFSWDNLTNKGLLRDPPDMVTVWNDAQRQEAEAMHRVPRDRIVVTGATAYDHWFAWQPTRDGAPFREEIGLPADGPLLLYLCSSPFIAPDEVAFVRRWLAAVRDALDPRVGDSAVLVRPHPQNAHQWRDVDLGDARATVWPRAGADPVDPRSRAVYHDSIHHADAVVGINTSAQIESAILGRPVLTVLDAHFDATQSGTLHFHHLADEDGMLIVAADLEAHVADLAAALEPSEAWRARNRRFLQSFVRPHGLERPASPLLADAIERAAAGGSLPEPRSVYLGRPVVQRALRPLAWQARRRYAQAIEQRRAARLARRLSGGDAVAEARETLAQLAVGDEPVLAGPFTSEVGYELLYWIPFLRRALEEHPGLRERLVVVSRGGSAPWYAELGVRYAELFDQLTPEELRSRLDDAALTQSQHKQMVISELDEELLAEMAQALGVAEHRVLHPSTMYRAFWQLVKRGELLEEPGRRLLAHRPLPAPEPSAELSALLPAEYVAVRFYFRASLPDDAVNRAWIAGALRSLTERTSVVLLNPSLNIDDHWDYEADGANRLVQVDHLMTPSDNLAVQTAIIARARCFVGTYGGLAYLPPLLGRPSWSFHSEPRFKDHHLRLAKMVFSDTDFGDFRVDARRHVPPEAVASAADGVIGRIAEP